MAMTITEECISCGTCEQECPNNAISEGEDIYLIDAALCTECEGVEDGPKCVGACPIECIVPLPE